jgi:hypothetical protein
MTDLERLMRAVKVIAKLAWQYEAKDVADALMQHATLRERENVRFVADYLSEVESYYREAHAATEQRCVECGGMIYDSRNGGASDKAIGHLLSTDAQTIARWAGTQYSPVRSNARYCSAKCRQKAYRKRQAARDGNKALNQLPNVTKSENVTDMPHEEATQS